MTVGMVTNLRNARANQIKTYVDAGGAAGTFRVYDGTRPATGGTATTLLATLTMSYPSAPSASGGVLTFSAITSATAGATSTATWGRLCDSTGAVVEDFSVGTSGADFNLSTVSIVSGVNVACTSATSSEGNA